MGFAAYGYAFCSLFILNKCSFSSNFSEMSLSAHAAIFALTPCSSLERRSEALGAGKFMENVHHLTKKISGSCTIYVTIYRSVSGFFLSSVVFIDLLSTRHFYRFFFLLAALNGRLWRPSFGIAEADEFLLVFVILPPKWPMMALHLLAAAFIDRPTGSRRPFLIPAAADFMRSFFFYHDRFFFHFILIRLVSSGETFS